MGSNYPCRYPELLDGQLDLIYNGSIQLAQLIPQVQEKIKLVAEGRIPHAENVLNSLMGKLSLLLLE